MRFTLVIFSTYKFYTESLASAKWTLSFIMFKESIILFIITLKVNIQKYNRLSKTKNNFLLKEIFFTSPQLKITLFKPVFLQLTLMSFVSKTLGNKNYQNIKRIANVSTY
jgi:hypothetical protein